MRIVRRLLEVASITVIVFAAMTAIQAQTIHLVTAADFRSFPSKPALASVKNDVIHMVQFFQRNTPSHALKVYSVDGNMATPEAICEAIENVQSAKNDTIVFYYSGHAANAAEQGGQYFQLLDKKRKAAPLARSKVRNLLCDKRPRLVVLLTDCCNVYQPQELDKDTYYAYTGKRPADFAPIMKKLFLEPTGVVNITSSKFGQASFTGQGGSIATDAWISSLEELNTSLKSNTQKELTWKSTLNEFTLSSDRLFKKRYPKGEPQTKQKTQVPHAYELPGEPRLGVGVVTMGNGNVLVEQVLEDSPGAKAGFKKGDLITHINGQEILDEQAYSRAIDISSSLAKITYKRDKEELKTEVQLRGVPQKPQVEPSASNTAQRGQATEDAAFQSNDSESNTNRTRQNNRSGNETNTSGPVFGASVQGNKIVKIVENSPAALAGLAVDDLIIKFNDITIKTAQDFSTAVDKSSVNAILVIQRKGSNEQTEFSVTLNKPKSQAQTTQTAHTNTSSNETTNSSQKPPVFGASVQGNKIVKIVENSPAAAAGLSVGDVILKFNDIEIKKAEDFEQAVDASEPIAYLQIQEGSTGQKKNIYVNLAK